MTCKLYGKRGNSNRTPNPLLSNCIGYAYTQVLIFVFLGINDMKYTLKVYNYLE